MEKRQGPLKKAPCLDMFRCTDCEACLVLCPRVFAKNDQSGCIEVVDLPEYPEKEVEEAMAMCPGACIAWQGSS